MSTPTPPSRTSDAELSTAKSVASTPCEHDWMERGTEGDRWRECFLCGQQCDGCIADAQNDWFGPPHACEEEW